MSITKSLTSLNTSNLSPWSYLPSERWRIATTYSGPQAGFSILHPVSSAISSIEGIIYQFANFVWTVIVELLKFAANSSSASPVVGDVNSAFYTLSNGVTSGFIFALVFIAAVALFLRDAIRSRSTTAAIKNAFFIVIPIITLVLMSQSAQNNINPTQLSNGSYAFNRGTPGWLIQSASNLPNDLGATPALIQNTLSLGASTNQSSCSYYIAALHGEASKKFGNNTQGDLNIAISELWESSFLSSWVSSYFPTDAGQNAYCHYLDEASIPGASATNTSLSPASQQQISALAHSTYGDPTPAPPNAAVSSPQTVNFGGAVPTTLNSGIYGPFPPGDVSETYASVAWAVCSYQNGQWVSSPIFSDLVVPDPNNSGANTTWGLLNKNGNGPCFNWYNSGAGLFVTTSATGSTNAPFDLFGSKAQAEAYSTNWANPTYQAEAYQYLDHIGGGSNSANIVAAIVALITSLVYLFSFGGIAIALLLSHIGFEIVVILSPILLLLLMFQATRRKTIGLFLAGASLALMNLIFVFLISLFVLVSGMMISLLSGLGSTVSAIGASLGPLGALFLITALMKHYGLPSLMNPLSASRIGLSMASSQVRNGAPEFMSPFSRGGVKALGRQLRDSHLGRFSKMGSNFLTSRELRTGFGLKSPKMRIETAHQKVINRKKDKNSISDVIDGFGNPKKPKGGVGVGGGVGGGVGKGGKGVGVSAGKANTSVGATSEAATGGKGTRKVKGKVASDSPSILSDDPSMMPLGGASVLPDGGQIDGGVSAKPVKNRSVPLTSELRDEDYVQLDDFNDFNPLEMGTNPPNQKLYRGTGGGEINGSEPIVEGSFDAKEWVREVNSGSASSASIEDGADENYFDERHNMMRASFKEAMPSVNWDSFQFPEYFDDMKPSQQKAYVNDYIIRQREEKHTRTKNKLRVAGAVVGVAGAVVVGAPMAVGALAGVAALKLASNQSYRAMRLMDWKNDSAAVRGVSRVIRKTGVPKVVGAAANKFVVDPTNKFVVDPAKRGANRVADSARGIWNESINRQNAQGQDANPPRLVDNISQTSNNNQ